MTRILVGGRAGHLGGRAGHPLGLGGARTALAFVLPVLVGCGLPRQMTRDAMVPILDGALISAYAQADVDLVEAGIPGNLLLVEGLVASYPNDVRIRTIAAQLYTSFALGFVEPGNPDRAEGLYSTARAHAFSAYPDLHPDEHRGREGERTYAEALAGYDAEDIPGLLWLAASWGNHVKLNLDDPDALAEVPRVEALAAHLVELDGDYLFGMPHLLLGTLRSIQPPLYGGDPVAARDAFDTAFAVTDRRFLLVHLFLAEYHATQVFDEALFESTLTEMLGRDPAALPGARLLNEVAQRQGRALLDRQADIF